jgi:hypothetical protein
MEAKKEIYNERLLRFASYLINLKFVHTPTLNETFVAWVGTYARTFTIVLYNPEIFQILPEVFKEWRYAMNTKLAEPMYLDIGTVENHRVIRGSLIFFGLSPEELVHIFDLAGYQNIEKYGGVKLKKDSSPQEIAYNINELLKKRNDESSRRKI